MKPDLRKQARQMAAHWASPAPAALVFPLRPHHQHHTRPARCFWLGCWPPACSPASRTRTPPSARPSPALQSLRLQQVPSQKGPGGTQTEAAVPRTQLRAANTADARQVGKGMEDVLISKNSQDRRHVKNQERKRHI